MPTQQQYKNIKPQDLGLPSFESLYQIPGLTPEEQTRLQLYAKQTDQAAAQGGMNAGAALQQAKDQFKAFHQSLLNRPNSYIPPPATNAAQTQPPPAAAPPTTPVQTAGVAAVPAPGAASTTAPRMSGGQIDYEAELMKLLGGNSRHDEEIRGMQLERIRKDMNAPGFGAEDQKILDIATARAKQVAAERTDQGNTVLAGQNLTGGGAMLRNYQAETDRLSQFILDKEVEVRTNALNRATGLRQQAYVNSENFLRALHTNNAELAGHLVGLYKVQVEADLNDRQLAMQKEAQDESIRLSRDQFTEDKRRAMRNEGFTEQQIASAEQQMLWQRAFNEKQQTADIDLANRNLSYQERIADRTASQEDKRIALQEIKDNRGYSIDKAMADLQERQFLFQSGLDSTKMAEVVKMNDFERTKFLQSMGFERDKFDATMKMDRDEFEAQAKELERRFGLDVNRFELEKALSTGELNWKIFESQRRYDLDAEDQRQKWLASDAARELQEKLGMTELEIRQALGEGELDARREEMLLEKWMFQENIGFEKYKFAEQLKAAKRKKKGSFLGGLVKTLVGGAVGFFTGGGPVGALAGALSANGVNITGGGSQSSAGADFANATRVPESAPDASYDIWGR